MRYADERYETPGIVSKISFWSTYVLSVILIAVSYFKVLIHGYAFGLVCLLLGILGCWVSKILLNIHLKSYVYVLALLMSGFTFLGAFSSVAPLWGFIGWVLYLTATVLAGWSSSSKYV